MWYTFIFAVGLASILVPVNLGLRFIISFFDSFHSQIYYLGSLFLIAMGVMTLKPFFHLPQFFHVKLKVEKKITTGSVFGLGLMSGITSSCCAPVLFAAVTLTTLSPSLLQAFIVSLAYVLGIVFPLFLLSLGYEQLTTRFIGEHRKQLHDVLTYLGAGIFILAGIAVALFNWMGKIQMYQMEGYSKTIRLFVFEIAKRFQNPFLDITFFIFILIIFYFMVRRSAK